MFGKKTEVIECLLVGCKNHDGKHMACGLRRVEIGSDGFCSQFQQLTNKELLEKGEGRISNV